jgi:K+-transporting ATPase ATPase A chain
MGVDPGAGMGWKAYLGAILLFNALGFGLLFALLKGQGHLPLNPQGFGGLPTDLAFNTAASFVSNTNWQAYAGETTMGYLAQMAGLSVQNFLSAATGLAVLVALTRGLARRGTEDLGNAWADLVRGTLYVLLPASFFLALVFVSQGVLQNLSPYLHAAAGQVMPMGPMASQEAIKLLGTNGGGFLNANSAHPFANPTPLTNFLQVLAIFAIPAGLCFTFGRMVKDLRQGWVVLGAMALIFVAALAPLTQAEQRGNPALANLPVNQLRVDTPGLEQAGGNEEGKEVRFGIGGSTLFAAVTTAASCGAVNGMHDSFTPLGGLVPLVLMQLGEVAFGGVGSGLYGMLVFALIAVFISGLMVGRTPEYLGKKVEAFEMKMAALVILIPPAVVLIGTAIATMLPSAAASVSNPGPHGFSQILYAFTSCANNNGSAFAGLNANTPFWNYALAFAMLAGRFGVLAPVLALAGSLAAKKVTPAGPGTLPTHTPLFMVLLAATVILVGALTFIPSLALGPIAEHVMLR